MAACHRLNKGLLIILDRFGTAVGPGEAHGGNSTYEYGTRPRMIPLR